MVNAPSDAPSMNLVAARVDGLMLKNIGSFPSRCGVLVPDSPRAESQYVQFVAKDLRPASVPSQ
jgi:hypothetical protein